MDSLKTSHGLRYCSSLYIRTIHGAALVHVPKWKEKRTQLLASLFRQKWLVARRGSRILKWGLNFWQRNVTKAWKRGVFGLHAGQCVCGLKMNKLIGRTGHRLCTFSTSIREIREVKYYFNIWGIIKKKKEGGSEKGGVKIHPFHLPWIRAWFSPSYSQLTEGTGADYWRE